MKIITITLNPAFDVHYKMKNFQLHRENYVDTMSVFAGGKGINVSRALRSNGMDSTAFIAFGRENSDRFITMLDANGVRWGGVFCDGRIRENVTIHTVGGEETRISLDDFSLSEPMLNQLYSEMKGVVCKDTIVAFSGRIPRGLSKESVLGFLGNLRATGAKLCVDCNSFSFPDLLELKPFLVKPNEQEATKFCGAPVGSMEEAVAAAKKIRESGLENVVISMGKDGAAFAGDGMSCVAKVPKITPLSTIGAGDSTVAGFIAAYAEGKNIEQCLINAVSFGTAACLTEGTLPPLPADVMHIKTLTRLVF